MKMILTVSLLLLGLGAFAQNSLNIYISSRNTHSIKRYQTDGTYLGDFVAPGAGGLSKPQDLFFHPHDGTLLVTGIDNDHILRFDAQTGVFLGNFSTGYELDGPTKMRIGPDSLIYVSQWGATQNKVARFGLDGVFVDEFTSTGVPNGCGMDWDAAARLYVTSYGNGINGSVHFFDTSGTFIGIFIGTNQVDGPVGLWKTSNNQWMVTDWTRGTVDRFDGQGTPLGNYVSGLTRVEGHTFDEEGRLYLCDWEDDLVKRFLPDGTFDTLLINSGGLLAPNGIIFGPAPEITSSTELQQEDLAIHIFPNPVQDSFTVAAPALIGKRVNIRVMDAQGKIVVRQTIDTFGESQQISVAELPPGTYHCELSEDKALQYRGTFIKA